MVTWQIMVMHFLVGLYKKLFGRKMARNNRVNFNTLNILTSTHGGIISPISWQQNTQLFSFLYHLKVERILIIESISPKASVENSSAQWAIFNLIWTKVVLSFHQNVLFNRLRGIFDVVGSLIYASSCSDWPSLLFLQKKLVP